MDMPTTASFSMYGVTYLVDLEACRIRMLERVAELTATPPHPRGGPRHGGMQTIAEEAGVDRATLRRFFRGERLTVETFVSIITRGLKLDVSAVARKAA